MRSRSSCARLACDAASVRRLCTVCASLVASVAALYCVGAQLDWEALSNHKTEQHKLVSMPTYAFERQRYCVGARWQRIEAREDVGRVRPECAERDLASSGATHLRESGRDVRTVLRRRA